MLLDSLLEITTAGAQKPIGFWDIDFEKRAQELSRSLKKTHDSLEDGTDVKLNLAALIELLKDDKPNEFALAGVLVRISGVFLKNTPSDKKEIIQKYFSTSRGFYKRAQTAEFHKRERENLKRSLNEEKQREYNLRLFNGEGMLYVMEFYLALYKELVMAKTEEESRKLIENKEIDLGFGGVPGLKEDFVNDEALDKFVYKVLDDNMRGEMLSSYYNLKEILLSDILEIPKIIDSLRNFLMVLLDVFQEAGVEKLSSTFFKPYGDKPKLSDIKL